MTRQADQLAVWGDINNDGMADLIIGALSGGVASGRDAGEIYVVFGSNPRQWWII